MLRSVFGKSLRDRRIPLLWWTIGIVGYMMLLGSSFTFIEEAGSELEDLLEAYPEGLWALFGVGDADAFLSAAGFLQAQAFGWLVPLVFALYGGALGARAIAGEEEANTMDLLLANPITRRRIVVEKSAAMVVALTVIAVALFVGIFLGRVFGMDIPVGDIAAACVGALILGWVFGTLALAVGASTGRRGLALAVAAVAAVVSYLIDSLASLVEWIEAIEPLSPFYLYSANEPLINGLAWTHGLLAAIGVVLVGIATFGFQRRDVAV